MKGIKTGELIEAFFYPDIWDKATFIGMDGNGYVVRTVDGYKCATKIRNRREEILKSKADHDKKIKQLAYDAIDFLRVLEEDDHFRFWGEGCYNHQVLEELREDAKNLKII